MAAPSRSLALVKRPREVDCSAGLAAHGRADRFGRLALHSDRLHLQYVHGDHVRMNSMDY